MVMADNLSIANADQKMKKTLEAIQRELSTIRTGRAAPSLIEHLKVEYAGAVLPLIQLGGISSPTASSLAIQPWDKNAMGPIEKAILKSELGLTPINDGRMIRINIPPLNEERRQSLMKIVKRHIEEGKIALRNVRHAAQDELKTQEKDKVISQDEHKLLQNQLQKLIDKYTLLIDQAGKDKEKEVMEV
jgi:ribosome recycling factor